jgi:hypothetical protein
MVWAPADRLAGKVVVRVATPLELATADPKACGVDSTLNCTVPTNPLAVTVMDPPAVGVEVLAVTVAGTLYWADAVPTDSASTAVKPHKAARTLVRLEEGGFIMAEPDLSKDAFKCTATGAVAKGDPWWLVTIYRELIDRK